MHKNTKNKPAIIIKGVSKYFKPSKGHGSLKQKFLGAFGNSRHTVDSGYWAVNDVDLEVYDGEFFGIVGRNGSGKSTLLKMIAGVYTPSKGSIKVNGKLVPFIELGVGFNPELTGRDNVFLNGALLGFSRNEMQSMYDSIVEFAELEGHMDIKLKNFSSGMQVRLAFSIAIRAQSDILLIDEVLAVGDAAFQQKCYDYFFKLKEQKRTIIFVSHDMSTIKRFCDRAMLIDKSKLIDINKPHIIASQYEKLNFSNRQPIEGESKDRRFSIGLANAEGKPTHNYSHLERMKVVVKWDADLPVENIGLAIFKEGTVIYGTNTLKGVKLKDTEAILEVVLNLGPGKYRVVGGVFGKTKVHVLEFDSNGPEFTVMSPASSLVDEWEGVTKLTSEWL